MPAERCRHHTATITVTGAIAAGAGGDSQAIGLGGGTAPAVGEFVVVAGNDQPTYVTAIAGDPVDHMTLNEVNKYASSAGAACVRYAACAAAAGYAAGWTGSVVDATPAARPAGGIVARKVQAGTTP
jgi:hypothetical protein